MFICASSYQIPIIPVHVGSTPVQPVSMSGTLESTSMLMSQCVPTLHQLFEHVLPLNGKHEVCSTAYLVFMALFSAGSSLTYAPFVLNVMTTSLPSILPLVAFPKGLFSALYSSSCTPHLSVLLSLLFRSTTTFTQMILSSSSLFTYSTSTQAFLTFKTLFNTSHPG